jgi:hypothetical protein
MPCPTFSFHCRKLLPSLWRITYLYLHLRQADIFLPSMMDYACHIWGSAARSHVKEASYPMGTNIFSSKVKRAVCEPKHSPPRLVVQANIYSPTRLHNEVASGVASNLCLFCCGHTGSRAARHQPNNGAAGSYYGNVATLLQRFDHQTSAHYVIMTDYLPLFSFLVSEVTFGNTPTTFWVIS